jgi:hypothetical protein
LQQLGPPEPPPSLIMHPRVRLAVLAGVVSLAATGVAVAGGVFSVGDVIPAGAPTGGVDAPRADVEQRVVAEGSTPVGGSWWITSYESERLLDSRGGEMQPAGLPCLSLILRDPPEGTRMVRRWFCGERGEDGFNAAGLPVNAPGGSEVILFGQAPERASVVEFAGAGGQRIRARTHSGPPGVQGDLWVIPVPATDATQDGEVAWASEVHGQTGVRLDVSSDLNRRLAP